MKDHPTFRRPASWRPQPDVTRGDPNFPHTLHGPRLRKKSHFKDQHRPGEHTPLKKPIKRSD